ncbi:uncharacterized protein BJ212DRAFT_1063195 [Suillus subaureus]|uniref:F-box domain-containing protein n=1 Tax=Suillus subaureus TaxID=48587 RepID=A0A9P7EFU6_9AGAM|nr:uncharacterized protein BJ212DRAFT_1063195 [Suillus subaureus]KAG1819722.1 hypothetical protein BJ212DRAFT_1063195 [Suillus subaureus]
MYFRTQLGLLMTPTLIKTSSKEYMKALCKILASSFFHSVSSVSVMPTEPYIHLLPVELLQQIFLFIVNSAPDYPSIFSCEHDTISVNVASPPLVLTRVCHLWRVVAYSTTGVWSRIQVVLPGEVRWFRPFLPHFLQCWLARSGNLPLTLRIVNNDTPCCMCTCLRSRDYFWLTAPNSRLLNILLSESKRWETVVMPPACNWDLSIDTPQLKALECDFFDLSKFHAPNLSRLHINTHYLVPLSGLRIPLYKDIRHLHLRDASVCALCSSVTDFPHLETIAVDEIYWFNIPGTSSYSATLESMTLPLPSSYHFWQEFINMFSLLHLPVFRKLTLVGTPKKRQVHDLLSMLAVASFRIPVLDFQTDVPLRKVHMNSIESLLSVVGEVTF